MTCINVAVHFGKNPGRHVLKTDAAHANDTSIHFQAHAVVNLVICKRDMVFEYAIPAKHIVIDK
jgi:hypothetical protein